MVLGQIYYNQGIDIANVNKTIRPPQGGKLKPEELKKKKSCETWWIKNMMRQSSILKK